MLRNSLMIVLASISLACFAQVYKHVDENGNVTFTDQPPPNAERIEIREPNTLAPPPIMAYPEETPEELTPASVNYEVKITAPAHETTIPNGPGNFSVSANISPNLETDAHLQLLLDGESRGEPQRSSSWALTNVFRGAHVLEVVVLDSKNQELAKSAPITVFVFRPSRNR